MKLRNFLFFPLFLFSFAANASDSITYSIASRMIDTTEKLSLGLYDSIAIAYKPLYVSIAIIGLTLMILKYMWTGVTPLREMMSFLFSMMISSAFAFDSQLFKSVIYDTFFDTLYRMNQFVIQSSAQNMTEIGFINFSDIEGMFRAVDGSLMAIAEFAWGVSNDNSNLSLSSIPILIQALIICMLYLFIGVYFLVMFTISILGAHMMIILMPITLSLYPFKKFRQYSTNALMGMVYYGLVTLFVCISISLVVLITNDLVVESNKIIDEANANGSDIVFPADFLMGSIMVGLLSIFIIKSAPEFASRLLNAASTQLGGAFPMLIAAGVAASNFVGLGRLGEKKYSSGDVKNSITSGVGRLRDTFKSPAIDQTGGYGVGIYKK